MTTIAANHELMAADSKVTLESVVEDRTYSCTKLFRHINGDIIGCAGASQTIELFMKWYGSKKKKPVLAKDIEFEALVLDSKGNLKVYDDTFSHDIINHGFYAIGSGGNAARAAMIMGADPIKAIEIACQVDPHSSPPIGIINLNRVIE